MSNYAADTAEGRAAAIKKSGSLEAAVKGNLMRQFQDITVSEALVLGLLNQGVSKYIGIFGHGSTDIGNMLSIYEQQGLVKFFNVRSEVEAAHCVSALKWQYGETAAVVTSIGPGALNAMTGSLVASSNGLGVYHIYGDETTHAEGQNMQQIPKYEQASYLSMAKTMAAGYQISTPESIFTALKRGAAQVFNPIFAGPFYFLMSMNVQPAFIPECNLLELPQKPYFPPVRAEDDAIFEKTAALIKQAKSITIKFGGGAAHCGAEIEELAELIDAVIVSGAKMSGVVPYSAKRHMSVGGSKGTLCGNHAMNNADLVIAIGARYVCQWDCSGTAWKRVKNVVAFNADPYYSSFYNCSVSIVGDAKLNLQTLIEQLKARGFSPNQRDSNWLSENIANKQRWEQEKQRRLESPVLYSETWGREVLTYPAAIHTVCKFARENGDVTYFDAGDTQACGFQVVEDEAPGKTFSDTGASFMGFAASALLSSGVADNPEYGFAISGDGSFTMNPQILFDGIEHNAKGCLVILDNRAMYAISALQKAQYGKAFKTNDSVSIDYVALAESVKGVLGLHGGYSIEELNDALARAREHDGLSLIHVPLYSGDHELGGLGAYGDWNIGNWCEEVQKEKHRIGL